MSLAAATDRFCSVCGTLFHPRTTLASVCGPVCGGKYGRALEKARKERVKAERKKAREQKAKDKERLLALDTQALKKAAEKEFNAWVRLRDADQPCISCGALPEPWKFHGGRDAGHWRSVKAAGHLRYHEDNVHAQCVACNQWGAGKSVEYRIGLVKRIGVERVEALENNNTPHKWTTEELIAIRDKYRAKKRELEKERGC